MKQTNCKFCKIAIKWIYESNKWVAYDDSGPHSCEQFKEILEKKKKKNDILERFKDTGASFEKVVEFIEKNKQSNRGILKHYLKQKGVHPYIINKSLSKVLGRPAKHKT